MVQFHGGVKSWNGAIIEKKYVYKSSPQNFLCLRAELFYLFPLDYLV